MLYGFSFRVVGMAWGRVFDGEVVDDIELDWVMVNCPDRARMAFKFWGFLTKLTWVPTVLIHIQ